MKFFIESQIQNLTQKIQNGSSWYILAYSLLILLIPLSHQVNAQGPELDQGTDISSSWNPVGSGARALGFGGAFIAVADDATAASWNPGGLIQLEKPEFSIVGAYVYRKEENTSISQPEVSDVQSISSSDINYLSLAYPFSLFNRNMVVSFTYQNLFDFNRKAMFTVTEDDDGIFAERNLNLRNEGNLSAIGVSYAVGLTPEFSLGITFNYWEDWLGNHGWQEKTQESTTGILKDPIFPIPFLLESKIQKDHSLSGFNVNLGFLWRVTAGLTVGGVVKTPFTAELDIKTTTTTLFQVVGIPVPAETRTFRENLDLEVPISYGLGLSYRFSDAFTVAADIYRTEWDDFLLERPSGKESPITGLSKAESDIDPTTQVRIGCEYLLIGSQYVIPIRGGLFYDPVPAKGSPDDIFGVSIGSGIAWKRLIFDIAYQYRWGNNIGTSTNREFDFSSDLKEHTAYSSLIIHF